MTTPTDRARTGSAYLALAASVSLVLSACEVNNNSSLSAKIAVRLNRLGFVEVFGFACSPLPLSALAANDLTQPPGTTIWSATPNSAVTSLVQVTADGTSDGAWSQQGSMKKDSLSQDIQVSIALASPTSKDLQVLIFHPSELSTQALTVASTSFDGKDSVSQDDFVRVNKEWCARDAARAS